MDALSIPFVSWALGLGMVIAILNWIAVVWEIKWLEYVCKPAVLAIFVIAAWRLAAATGWGWLARWFIPALIFSLLGDILLMLPGERWFVPGLLAFLLAQLAYIVGLNANLPPPAALWLLIGVAAVDWVVLRRVVAGVRRSGARELVVPVLIYGVILSLTLFSGWATWFRPLWSVAARVAATLGVTLFYASDLMLAWDRFVHRARALQVAVMVTYHLAQLALILTMGWAP